MEGKYKSGDEYDQLFAKLAGGRAGQVVLEAERNSDRMEMPRFTVAQSVKQPATRELMGRLMGGLIHRSIVPIVPREPMMLLHQNRGLIVEDYNLGQFVEHDRLRVESGEVRLLADTIEHDAVVEKLKLLAHQRGGSAISQAVVEAATRQTRAQIERLVGDEHEIRRTYRVGDVQATEVIPSGRVDPLFCVKLGGGQLDSSVNALFRVAFVRAMTGRINQNRFVLSQAVKVGELAGRTALNSCFGGASWSLAEIIFVSEIVYSDGSLLANGFANLSL